MYFHVSFHLCVHMFMYVRIRVRTVLMHLPAESLRNSYVEYSADRANQTCGVKSEAIAATADGHHASKTSVHSLT